MQVHKIDLPYAVKFKKRKINKKYDYKDNRIDRSNHTYFDYLDYVHKNINVFTVQMDFLGSIKSDISSILTLTIPNLHFVLLYKVRKPNSQKNVELFDKIENSIGLVNFRKLFPVILTDRDPCFSDITNIEFSKVNGEQRTQIFFCDPYVSC